MAMKQVQLHDHLDNWVFHFKSRHRQERLRRLCVLDKGWVVWGMPLADRVPGGAAAFAQPSSMFAVTQGVLMVGAGIIPHRRTELLSGTCLRMSDEQMEGLAAASMKHFFDGGRVRVWGSRNGGKWLSTAQNGDVVWTFSLGTDGMSPPRDVVDLPGVGGVRLWGGIRPARVASLLPMDDVTDADGVREVLEPAVRSFFFG